MKKFQTKNNRRRILFHKDNPPFSLLIKYSLKKQFKVNQQKLVYYEEACKCDFSEYTVRSERV